MAKNASRRVRLTEDGELADDLILPETSGALVYCNSCGAPNPDDSNFCRKCGRSLLEQEAEMIGLPSRAPRSGGAKPKNIPRSEVMHDPHTPKQTNAAITTIMTMLAVAVMSILALVVWGGIHAIALIPILIAWISVEGIRTSKQGKMTDAEAMISIFTTLIMMGLTIVALVAGGGNGVLVIPIMILWISITGIRGS